MRADRLLAGHEPDEALEVCAAELFVRPRQARQLAEIRVAPLSVAAGEDREVVVVLGHDALAEELERRGRRDVEQSLVALPEGEEQALILVGEVAWERPLERPEDRLALRLGPDQDESVVRDPDEGRRQHGQERLVVVAVVQEPEVREQVDDLLLPEVVASGGAVGREADGAKLLLEPLGVRAGGEEEDDLARGRIPGIDELPNPLRDVPRFGPTPVDACLTGGLLVRDEQLEGGSQHGRATAVGRLERLELVSELRAEELVDRGEHLGAGAVVLRQR